MASFPQASSPTTCVHLYPPPYAPHALPISFVSILPPAQYWVRSTDHSAPRYAAFSPHNSESSEEAQDWSTVTLETERAKWPNPWCLWWWWWWWWWSTLNRITEDQNLPQQVCENFKVSHPRCVCNSLGGRRIVNTTQLIRKKVYILICINYMFRPTVTIIRFITDFKSKSYIWVGVLIKRSLVSIFLLMSGVVTVTSTRTIS